jgi:methyl-accepting chemotaxis protein
MQLIHHLSIGRRIAAGFAVAIALLVGLAGLAIHQGSASERAVRTMLERDFVATSRLQAIDGNVVRIHRAMKDVALSKTPEALEAAVATVPALEKAIDADLDTARRTGAVPAAALDAVRAALDAWQQFRGQTVQLMREGRAEEAAERTRAQGAALAEQLIGTVGKVVEATQARTRREADETVAALQATRTVMLCACTAAVVLMLLYGARVIRSMRAPLRQAVALAEAVAAGQLSAHGALPDGRDEFSRLLQALGRMNANLVGIIQRVRSSRDRKSTRLNSSHNPASRMPSSA